MNNERITILGISEEVTTCDCCGRSHLKRTVALKTDGGVVHYGCDCAAKAYRHAGVRNLNAAAVKELGHWASKAAKFGAERTIARYGNRSLELVPA